MTPEIWADLRVRMWNLRGDMIGQWQGALDNRAVEQTIMLLGAAINQWELAQPAVPLPVVSPFLTSSDEKADA